MLPIGLASIAAYLEQHGVSVSSYEFGPLNGEPDEILDAYPEIGEAAIVGLSFYNQNALIAYEFARRLKRRNPNCTIVAGGPHATSYDVGVLDRCEDIDVCVRGEGEETFLELVKSPHAPVLGTTFRKAGKIERAPDRAKVDDLDRLPPPDLRFSGATPESLGFYDTRERRRRKAVPIVTSRSCPYRCSFCAIILIGRDWRKASPEKVASDFRELSRRHGPYEHVYFMDANFFVDPKRSLAIAHALNECDEQPTFSFSTRVNQIIRGRQQLEAMCDLGLRAIEVGVESASSNALKRFAKDVTPAQNDEAMEILQDLGVQLILDFIMFDAEADLSDLTENLEFLVRHGLDSYVPWDHLRSHLTPYAGTPIRTRYEQDLGLALPADRLPEPAELLQDSDAREVYTRMEEFFSRHDRLGGALRSLEQAVGTTPWGKDRARKTLLSMTLRRLPFVVLRSLLDQAQAGGATDLDTCIPRFERDGGTRIALEEVLDEVLATN